MDVAYYSHDLDEIIIANGKSLVFENYPEDKFTPIGVVVIPKEHNVYGDGTCGVMSLVNMSCDTPQEGVAQNVFIKWGIEGYDIPTMKNLNRIPLCSSMRSNTISSLYSTGSLPTTNPYQPSFGLSADGVAEYRGDGTLAPSPYLLDGSRNPVYYQIDGASSTANALSDLDGRSNTDKILAERGERDYATWKPDAETMEDYPAASCCDMFCPIGTKQGDWYHPSAGEFGYVIVRWKEINDTINSIGSYYKNTSAWYIHGWSYYLSSSELSAVDAWSFFTHNGSIYNMGHKSKNAMIRAFTKL